MTDPRTLRGAGDEVAAPADPAAPRAGAEASAARSIGNTFQLPCIPRRVIAVHGPRDISKAIELASCLELPVLPLGAASNVVLPAALEAVVLKAGGKAVTPLRESASHVEIRVEGGCDWHTLVETTLARGWYGFENLALIPGTVGAAPVQNIGAYGRELDQFVLAVHGVDLHTGLEETMRREECAFTYRGSIFKTDLRNRFFITAVDFRLARTPMIEASYPRLREAIESGEYASTPEGVFAAVVDIRRARLPDPATHPNVGSFFENPIVSSEVARALRDKHPNAPVQDLGDRRVKLSAAWLIEAAGLRGLRRGPVTVSHRHALVLENLGGASQAQVLELAEEVRVTVSTRFSVSLRIEPRIYDAGAGERRDA